MVGYIGQQQPYLYKTVLWQYGTVSDGNTMVNVKKRQYFLLLLHNQ